MILIFVFKTSRTGGSGCCSCFAWYVAILEVDSTQCFDAHDSVGHRPSCYCVVHRGHRCSWGDTGIDLGTCRTLGSSSYDMHAASVIQIDTCDQVAAPELNRFSFWDLSFATRSSLFDRGILFSKLNGPILKLAT